jgi:hypothetical protein
LNPRPPGYEPDELPGCSTPRRSGPLGTAPARGVVEGDIIATPPRPSSAMKKREALSDRPLFDARGFF